MKFQEVEKIYTEKVSELLTQGWRINVTTMGGTQGELAHVDLTDGSEIRRVLFTRERCYRDPDGFNGDKLVITVGTNTDQLRSGYDAPIWNNRLSVSFRIEFAEIAALGYRNPTGWFVPMAKAREIELQRKIRFVTRDMPYCQDSPDSFKPVVLRWLRKQPRMKSCKLEDIQEIERWVLDNGRRYFRIKARDRWFELGRKLATRKG